MDVDVDEIAQVNVVNHDTTPFSDAEINTVPSLPEIKEGEPLPKDLQELVDRCTQLSETEKQELAKVLRKHHDIFAKDNTTFAHGYHNLEIHPDDQPKTAIILPEGLGLAHRQFEFTRSSFGLAAAPGAFQYITDRVITPAKVKTPENDLGETVSVYLDDICIGGDNFTQMLQKLEALFNRIRAAGFLLKAKKCELFQPEVSYLGHKLSEKGIKTDQNKIDKILKERKRIRLTNNTITVNWTKVVPDGMSPTDIRKAKLLDPDIMPLMVAVQDQKKPEFQEIAENSNRTRSLWFQFNSLVIEGGVLYRKFEHPSGLKEKEELQLILPTKLEGVLHRRWHVVLKAEKDMNTY
ncbi:Retrovirus-related Pol polyprotein from transposon 17.6 [Frankliniella fusca]|uniref:Retrovirus-related Pol polyprotein from transposon 17.6 n=1 Tax=Frankliniella fusca TaxID=407009 RepID=A0AAE1I5G9_9NEOP|nr:Retrovirus-related Pol polyprotein from transposon 17.6 [Frankliniella fusca]